MGRSTSFTIGKVTGVHGLAGNLKVWSYAESVETFSPGRIVLLKFENEDGCTYTINRAAVHQKGILLNLDGIDNRDLAEALVGKEILIDRDQLPDPENDAWYWQDLIGLEVIDRVRGSIGRITRIFPTGGQDILVVTDETCGHKGHETLIPMHRRFVESVDIENNSMTVHWPEEE
jgi:16S rRNA processing protein RimM